MSKNLLVAREVVLRLAGAINDDLLPLELWTVCLNRGHVPHAPSNAQINFLYLPIL